MALTDMLTPESQTRGMEALPFNPTTFGEGFAAWTYENFYNLPVGISGNWLDEGQMSQDRNRQLEDITGRNISQEVRDEFPSYGADAVIAEYEKRTNDLIAQGRVQEPDKYAGIRTNQEISDIIMQQRQTTREAASEISAAGENALARYGAPLAAGLITAPLDPINLATMPLGAGAGMSVMRAVGVEALLNIGIEAVELPLIAQNEREMGYKFTAQDALIELGTAGAAAGGITAALRAGRGADRVIGNLRNKALDKIMANPSTPGELRSAAQYLYRTNQIDEAIEPSIRENMSIVDDAEAMLQEKSLNRINAQEAADAFANYRQPKFQGVSYRAMETVDEITPKIEVAPIKPNTRAGAVDGEWLMNGVMPKGTPGASIESGKRRGTGAGTRLQKGDEGYVGDRGLTNEEAEALGYPAEALAPEDSGSALNVVMRDKDGKPVGVASFSTVEKGSKEITPDTLAVFVPEANRRQGIATAMYDHLREQGYNIDAVSGRGSVTPDGAALATSVQSKRFRPEAAKADYSNESDLLFQPNDALGSMRADIDAADSASPAFAADFARLVAERPDEITIGPNGQEMSMRELSDLIKQGENELQAIRTCAIGGSV